VWNGDVISGNSAPTQSAVTGQLINLTTHPTVLPNGIGISQSTWDVGGTNVGSYAPMTSGAAAPAPTDLTQTTLNTYWAYSSGTGDSFEVRYQYCVDVEGLANPCSPLSTAPFSVAGGGLMLSVPYSLLTIDYLQVCGSPAGTMENFLVYGNIIGSNCAMTIPGSTPGIEFTPSGAPSAGTYTYAQLIDSDTWTIAQKCVSSQGLDGNYPYRGIIAGTNPLIAVDAPNSPLPNGYVVSRSFTATMFLLWTPSIANSIPVPIGYQTWEFAGGAQQNLQGVWIASTASAGTIGGFVSSSGSQQSDGYTLLQSGFPYWGGQATSTCN
jgi:hypothetical protein